MSKTSKVRLSEAQRRVLRILSSTDEARVYQSSVTLGLFIRDGRGLVDRVADSTMSVLARGGYAILTGNGYRITEAGRNALEESK